MNQEQADRFERWYRFIKDEVSNDDFDMASFIGGEENICDLFKKDKCGTTGCLAGYLPVVFDEFCYPSKESERPFLVSALFPKSNCGIITKKTAKKICNSDEDDEEYDEVLLDKQISNFFGIKEKDIEELIYAGNRVEENIPSRKEMLFNMQELADKYGWDIR